MCVFYVVVVAVVVVIVDVDDEEGEGRGEDAQRRKSNNPNLKGGEISVEPSVLLANLSRTVRSTSKSQ